MKRSTFIPAVVAVLALAAPTSAMAGGTLLTYCNAAPTSQVFSPWLDPSYYEPFGGGDFEHGASGWSWGGKANIVSGDDDHLIGTSGSHAVDIPGGGLAKTPQTCVDSTMPTLRFFFKRVAGTGNLTVNGTIAGKDGVALMSIATFAGSSTWQPSPVVLFPYSFLSAVTGQALNAQFQFVADPGTEYRIDDVELDPFKSR